VPLYYKLFQQYHSPVDTCRQKCWQQLKIHQKEHKWKCRRVNYVYQWQRFGYNAYVLTEIPEFHLW